MTEIRCMLSISIRIDSENSNFFSLLFSYSHSNEKEIWKREKKCAHRRHLEGRRQNDDDDGNDEDNDSKKRLEINRNLLPIKTELNQKRCNVEVLLQSAVVY